MKRFDLCVWKTLKRGRLNHWMLWGCPEVGWDFAGVREEHEFYLVGPKRMRLLAAFEALCGYRLVPFGPTWVFEKVNHATLAT
jgi:hypothetical protein